MNTNIFQTIYKAVTFGAVLSITFFAFTDSVFAAPVLLPTSVVEIKDTSATVRGYVQNYGESSVVWFEWSEASSVNAPTVVGMKNFFGDGFFETRLDGLTPGVTYSYRVAVKGRKDTVPTYSPVASFVTSNAGDTSSLNSSKQTNSALGTGPITTALAKTNAGTQQADTNTSTTLAEGKKQVVVTPPAVTQEGFTNTNAAAVIGAGNGMLPTTLVGWLLLIIAVLVAVLIAHMIYKTTEARKKELEEKKRKEEESETE